MTDVNDRIESTAPAPAAMAPGQSWQPWAGYVPAPDPRRKSPLVAGLLSILPGLGHVYLGLVVRGFVNAIAVATLFTVAASGPSEIQSGFALFLIFYWMYSAIDAIGSAGAHNHALLGFPGAERPRDLRVAGLSGSPAGGAALVIAGVVLLAHTRFGMSLAWIEQWWPVVPIAFGGWLAWRGYRERHPGPTP